MVTFPLNVDPAADIPALNDCTLVNALVEVVVIIFGAEMFPLNVAPLAEIPPINSCKFKLLFLAS